MGHTIDHLTPAPPAAFSDLDGNNGFAVHGVDIYDFLGQFLDGAGDVNGDGLDDLVIGAVGANPNNSSPYAGKNYVIFGKSGGFTAVFDPATLDGDNGFRLDGSKSYDRAYWAGGAGDINGDGLADIVIGAPAEGQAGEPEIGHGYAVLGAGTAFPPSQSLLVLDGSNGFSVDSIVAGDLLGSGASGAGDINGDGFDEVIFRAPGGATGEPAAAYVLFGSGQGFSASIDLATLDGINGFQLHGYQPLQGFNPQATDLGDINGDGFDDIIIGGNPSTVLFGTDQGFPPSIDLTAAPGNSGFQISSSAIGFFGFAVGGAGDVNGDGLADLMIGDFAADSSTGAVYIVFGNQEGFPANLDIATLNGVNGFRIAGEAGSKLGFSLSGTGDVNGDGVDDLLLGKKQLTSPDDYMIVVYGNAQGFAPVLDVATLDGSQGFRVYSTDGNDYGDGLTMANAGDVNGDGFHDVLAGSLFASPESLLWGGKVYTIFGNDFTASVTAAGTSGADTLTGTTGGDVMTGGAGDDSLQGNGGADVLKGGAGDDVLTVSDGGFQRVDGGGGWDRLMVDGFDLDLIATPDLRVQDIETIDLGDTTTNQVTLALRDLRTMSDTSNTITILGGNGDKVVIDLTGTGFQPTDLGNGFIEYTAQSVNNGLTLLVQDSLDLSGIIF